MAKTLWPTTPPFGFITPALQALWWGIGAATGHNHRGIDADGSCPKIALSDSVSDYATGTALGKVTTASYTVEQTNIPIFYIKIGRVVTITIPTVIGAQSAESGIFRITPVTTWPNEMIALQLTTGAPYVSCPILIDSIMETGQVRLPFGASEEFIFDRDGTATFTGGKGVRNTVLTYITAT